MKWKKLETGTETFYAIFCSAALFLPQNEFRSTGIFLTNVYWGKIQSENGSTHFFLRHQDWRSIQFDAGTLIIMQLLVRVDDLQNTEEYRRFVTFWPWPSTTPSFRTTLFQSQNSWHELNSARFTEIMIDRRFVEQHYRLAVAICCKLRTHVNSSQTGSNSPINAQFVAPAKVFFPDGNW